MHGITRIVAVVGTAFVLGACGGGDTGGDTSGGNGAADGGAAGATSLTMIDNEFQPADLAVASGTELELSNEGEAPHTFTVEGIDEQVDPGQSSSVTVDLEPGEYDFVCTFHEAQGMTGTLTVE
jgi:plastocyanin